MFSNVRGNGISVERRLRKEAIDLLLQVQSQGDWDEQAKKRKRGGHAVLDPCTGIWMSSVVL